MADHSGVLKKLGGGVMKQHQDRYFELRGRYLYYYKRQPVTAADKPQGDIDLKDTVIQDDPKNALAWTISGPALPKAYTLTASSSGDKQQWLGKLQAWKDTEKKLDTTGDPDEREAGSDEREGGSDAIVGKKVSLADFEAIAVVGKGAFGKVRKVYKKDTGAIYALKAMSKDVITREKLTEHTKAEKNILSMISHPFIVKLHFAFQDATKLYLVMDFLSGGEVFYHLGKCGTFDEHRAKFYTAEIASALGHIHGLKIIYRDLKPENCVLDRDGHCCLTDFGLAKSNVSAQEAGTFCGTPEYLAPEFLTGGLHGKAVDWWSLGVLFYEMMTGLPPFYSENVSEMYELILKKPLTFDTDVAVSESARDLCGKLLDRDPDTRMQEIKDFMAHACYAGWDWDAMLAKQMEVPFKPDPERLNFDEQFTSAEARDSMFDSAPVKGGNQDFRNFTPTDFKNFTYDGRGDGVLDK
eukprot:TRINITY_DN825_c0_g2_i1.p1 TRINITY_DN825_c0_g2~~TRINITY_DN825_c0_g2_i1.p1  ORF type:complete len:490 (+),score=196.38 TRINITY_DN825_c0_g2_i1:71-1471(+)